jgi:mRNA interferase HicA
MLRRADLERHLLECGCALRREGTKHAVWWNPATRQQSILPRHRELPLATARAIRRQLGVAGAHDVRSAGSAAQYPD